jgi:hypothetical protein
MIPLCLRLRALFSLNVFGNLLEPNTQKQTPFGAKPAENPGFGNPLALFNENPSHSGGKPCHLVFQ